MLRRSCHTGSRRLFATLALCLSLLGCAGPAKLAKRSQNQLTQGNPEKAYATALKAVRKDREHPEALAALREAGQELLTLDEQRCRAALPHDTLLAADVALTLSERRQEMASFGVIPPVDTVQILREEWVRHAAALVYLQQGEDVADEGNPKGAYAILQKASRLDPFDEEIQRRLRTTFDLAVDRVLILPVANDTRYSLSSDDLDPMEQPDFDRNVTRRHLEFTVFLDPQLAWRNASAQDFRGLTRDVADRVGRRSGASRVVWSRIYGDRLDTNRRSRMESVYRKTSVVGPNGQRVESWEARSCEVVTQDRWVSVLFECEIRDARTGWIVARRTGERNIGVRTVAALTPMAGSASEYSLWPPELAANDPSACRSLEKDWKARYGGISFAKLLERSCQRAEPISFSRSVCYGEMSEANRSLRVYYGELPSGEDMLRVATADTWREVAEAIQEADQK